MNIFVASLPFKLEESEIKEIFEDYGEVTSARLIMDKETGRSKGFGFVDMPNEEEALKAIEDLNGTEIYGRNISVSKAQEKKDNGGSRGGYSGGNRGGYSGGGRSGGYSGGGNRNGGGYNKGGNRGGGGRSYES
ncbi:RNA recognition motif domain-containing protein [Rubrolithibacter danxiaensis]|uniref:RNA recognition motif domain-containing protein n=1 Tax=Rubrolithibacter danxiaensis TaxID=3390805 RepID=UPI003BF81934